MTTKSFKTFTAELNEAMKEKLKIDTSQYKGGMIKSDKQADFTFNSEDDIKTFTGLWPAVEKKALAFFSKKRGVEKVYLTDVEYK